MKKFISLGIAICLMICLLTGCVQSEQAIKLGFTGKTSANVTITAENKLLKFLLISGFGLADNETTVNEDGETVASDTQITAQILSVYTDQLSDKLKEVYDAYEGDIESYKYSPTLGDQESSITIDMKFNNFSQMTDSAFFNTFFSFCPVTSLEDQNESAVYIAEKDGLFGKTYTFKGVADIAYVIDTYSAYFPAEDISNYNKESAKLTLKISSPYLIGSKTYVSEYGSPAIVDSNIFVLNPVILAAAIIIIALAVALIMAILKIRKFYDVDTCEFQECDCPECGECAQEEVVQEHFENTEETEKTENNEQ